MNRMIRIYKSTVTIHRFCNRNTLLLQNFDVQKRFQTNGNIDALNKILNSNEIIPNNINETIGQQYFSFLSDSPIIHKIEEFVVYLHDLTGQSWTFNILFTAFMLRLLICFPLRIYGEKVRAKHTNLQPVIHAKVMEKLRKNGVRVPTKEMFNKEVDKSRNK